LKEILESTACGTGKIDEILNMCTGKGSEWLILDPLYTLIPFDVERRFLRWSSARSNASLDHHACIYGLLCRKSVSIMVLT